jgi:hypothetical protein
VDLACNLVRMLDCDFIVELLADSNLDKTIIGSQILRIGGFVYPYSPPPPFTNIAVQNVNKAFVYIMEFTAPLRLISRKIIKNHYTTLLLY